MITRRNVLVLGVCAAVAPSSLHAQQAGKVARIGFLYFGARSSDGGRYNAFMQGMRDQGLVEGRDFTIEARFADGKAERAPALAADLVRLKADVIVATGTAVYRALQREAAGIPIVITVTADPVANGYAATVARPGGNITGLSDTAANIGPKYLELLAGVAPKASRIGILLHPDNVSHPAQLKSLLLAAQLSDIQIRVSEAGTAPDIEREIAQLAQKRINAFVILNDTFYFQQLPQIAALAAKHRLPSIYGTSDYPQAGGLMSYGADLTENFRRAATFVDKILKGTKPGDLPFEQPTRYYLVINKKTAKTLGVTIPNDMLLRADKVID